MVSGAMFGGQGSESVLGLVFGRKAQGQCAAASMGTKV